MEKRVDARNELEFKLESYGAVALYTGFGGGGYGGGSGFGGGGYRGGSGFGSAGRSNSLYGEGPGSPNRKPVYMMNEAEKEAFFNELEEENRRISRILRGSMLKVSSSVGSSGRSEEPKLTIRDFPASGFQLHIHEGEGGTAHIKTYDGRYANISSYEAAIADLLADKLKLLKIKKY